jgi:hypothetical protein
MRAAPIVALFLAASCSSQHELPPSTPLAPGEPSFVVEGRVESDLDEPVTVKLDTVIPWLDGMEKTLPQQPLVTTARPGGTFRFEGVRASTCYVSGTSPSSAAPYAPYYNVTADLHDLVVRVRPACTLVGHVTFGPGIDPAMCWVDWSQDGSSTTLGRGKAEKGTFRVERLLPGPCGVKVWHWPEGAGADKSLRVQKTVEATLRPGGNEVDVAIDASCPLVE